MVFALFSGASLYAQEQLDFAVNKTVVPKTNHFKTSSFQIEDQCILNIEDAVPNSLVEFYSSPHGGELVKRTCLNDKGQLQISFNADKSPSFVLNSPNSVDGSAKGSGFVQYLDKKDGIVRNIDLFKDQNTLSVNFESLTNPDKAVSYTLTSIDQTGKEELLHTFYTSYEKEWEIMNFDYELQPRTQYRFTVKSSGIERYTKVLYNPNGQTDFVVYPSVADHQIYVEFNQAVQKSPYTITDVKGVLVTQGDISELKTEIQIGEFSKGTYFIRLNKYPNDGVQFIKQ